MTVSTPPETLAWNCIAECADDPNTDCGVVFIAATDKDGDVHAFGACIDDILLQPHMYAGDYDYVVHGTHRLTTEQLDEAFGGEGERHMPPEHINLDTIPEWRPDGDTSPLVAVAMNVDSNNPEPEIITLNVLTDMYKRPAWYASDRLTLFGTHILTEEQIQHFFPGE